MQMARRTCRRQATQEETPPPGPLPEAGRGRKTESPLAPPSLPGKGDGELGLFSPAAAVFFSLARLQLQGDKAAELRAGEALEDRPEVQARGDLAQLVVHVGEQRRPRG